MPGARLEPGHRRRGAPPAGGRGRCSRRRRARARTYAGGPRRRGARDAAVARRRGAAPGRTPAVQATRAPAHRVARPPRVRDDRAPRRRARRARRRLRRGGAACLEPEVPFAVIGMGRLGGRRAVLRLRHRRPLRLRRRRARRTSTPPSGSRRGSWPRSADHERRPDLPHRRRPPARGQAGPARPLARGLPPYYEEYGLPWEFQSLLRARPVAGDPDVASASSRSSSRSCTATRFPSPTRSRSGG